MLPALICGCAGASTPEDSCTVPVSSALSASPPPGNTTVAIPCRPSRSLSTSACSCGVVPIGGVETLNLSGFFFASATNSFIVLDAEVRLDGEHVRRDRKLADRDEILERVVGQVLVEPGIDRKGAGREQDRVAVGLRARDQAHADIAAGAAFVLHDDRAADRLCMAAAMMRAMMSDGPPGVLATTILIGRSGIGGERRADAQSAGAAMPAGERAGRLDEGASRQDCI